MDVVCFQNLMCFGRDMGKMRVYEEQSIWTSHFGTFIFFNLLGGDWRVTAIYEKLWSFFVILHGAHSGVFLKE